MVDSTQNEQCVFCGDNPATTRDHVPPKGIFPPPRPGDLITVPACLGCNQATSGDDEDFRARLSLAVGVDSPLKEAFWEEARRTIKHNNRLKMGLVESTRDVWVKSPGGIIVDKGLTFGWPKESRERVILKITKGLYYHHLGEPIGKGAEIEFSRPSQHGIPEVLQDLMEYLNVIHIGDGQFSYAYGRADDHPLGTLWIYQFYGRFWCFAFTKPAEVDQGVRED